MSEALKTETPDVIDFLSDVDFSTPLVTQRVRKHRAQQRATKLFTECLKCGQPLIKYNTRWGTDDYKKAICKACKKLVCCAVCHCARVADGKPCCSKSCNHPRLKGFTFSDGKTVKICPDCTKFDEPRKKVLKGDYSRRPPRDVKLAREGGTVTLESAHESLSDVPIVGKCATGGAVFNYHAIEEKKASLMYRGHEKLPHTIGACFVIRHDAVKEADAIVPWFRNEPTRVPTAPPIQRKLVVVCSQPRTCISTSPYGWSQQTGWYQKKIGIVS